MTSDINNLLSFYAYEGTDHLQIGNGEGLPISNIGFSTFSLANHNISLHNILHVPQFFKNLISLSQFLHDNPIILVKFNSSFCLFKDPLTKTTLIEAKCTNGLFLHPFEAHFYFPSTSLSWNKSFGQHMACSTWSSIYIYYSAFTKFTKITL